MNSFLSSKMLTIVIGVPFVILFMALLAMHESYLQRSLITAVISSVLLAANVVALALSFDKVTSIAIRTANWLPGTNVPDLNGKWSVRQGSNWPRIRALLDCEDGENVESKALLTVDGLLTLRMNIFRISGSYEVLDAKSTRQSRTRESDIISASLTRRAGRTTLSYTAEALVEDPTPRMDENRYHFSALLVFGHDNVANAKGHYSTDRNWKDGLNTAGQMEITKIA